MIGVIIISICALVVAVIACEVVDFDAGLVGSSKSERRD
jgi:hypothetical protein